VKRVLSEAQKLAARDATRRYRARQRGESVDFVRSKRTQNAGTFTSERLSEHGMAHTRTWGAWKDMKARCSNPNLRNYPDYGGRGIRVCQRWIDSFENFLADMGQRPDGLSLERINNEGNYEPGNCKWATAKEQANNTRRNKNYRERYQVA